MNEALLIEKARKNYKTFREATDLSTRYFYLGKVSMIETLLAELTGKHPTDFSQLLEAEYDAANATDIDWWGATTGR